MIHQREGFQGKSCHQSLECLNLDCGCWRGTIRLRRGWSVVPQVYLAVQTWNYFRCTWHVVASKQGDLIPKENWFDHRHCRSERLKRGLQKISQEAGHQSLGDFLAPRGCGKCKPWLLMVEVSKKKTGLFNNYGEQKLVLMTISTTYLKASDSNSGFSMSTLVGI